MKARLSIPKVAFVQPVLAPYSAVRYQHLAYADDLEVHIILETERFVERPGWHPRPIKNCTLHIVKSLITQKRVHNRELRYTETFTKAIPYGITPLLFSISPEIVIFCNPTQLLLAMPFLIKKKCRAGLILEDTPHSQSHKQFFISCFRKKIYHYLDFVFCFSRDAEKYFRSLHLNAALYKSSWSIDPAWLKYSLRPKSKPEIVKFLFVGQLNPRKGIMPMLEAWSQFSQSEPNYKELNIVGEGPLDDDARSFCRKNCLNNVNFVGNISYSKVKHYYLESDVFILPSMEDLFSLVITEAMAFGLPIMTTIYNGASELVLPNENGWVFDSKDTSSIRQTFEKAWEKRNKLSIMGKKSKEIISNMTHDAVMDQMRMDIFCEFENFQETGKNRTLATLK